MEKPDPHILDFLSKHKVANVCLMRENNTPYCVSCFFVFDAANMYLLFKSSFGTSHDTFMKEDAPAAGTILPESLDLMQIKGIQFTGRLIPLSEAGSLKFSSLYTQTYMMSLALPGYMWGIKLEYIKLTDNSLGFGHKTVWGKLF